MYVQKLKGKDVHNKSTDGKFQWRNGHYKKEPSGNSKTKL